MLQAKVGKSYPKRDKNGVLRKMFICVVTGSEIELKRYVEVQSKRVPNAKWVDDDGNVFYWTSAPSGPVINLDITINGNVVEDTTNLDVKAASQARYDYTYNSVMAGLSGTGSGVRQQPVTKTEEPVTTPAGADPNSLED